MGDFSLTIVLYAEELRAIDRVLADFARIFTAADGALQPETYNQLNAYFAIVPGNYQTNLRKLLLLNTNYADLSFLFTVHPGETWNEHLGCEYLAVLETDNATPYYLNLHNREVAHTLVLGQPARVRVFLQLPLAECAEIPAADLHLRYRRQLPVAYPHLRRVVPECRPGIARLLHQSILAGANAGKSAISFLVVPRAH